MTAPIANASTHTSCGNDSQANTFQLGCKPDPAFGNQKVDCDFTKGFCKEFKALEGTDIKTNGQGAVFTIEKATNAPTIQTNKYIMFGRVDVTVQAAEGAGIVTSAVLQSDDLDEIDLEWVGGDNKQVQSNYFSKGDTTTYDRGAFHAVGAPLTSTHTYSIEWTKDKVDWLIDDKVVRTLLAANAHGANGFPQTPMQIKLGTWVAGLPDKSKWTVEWAGGLTDFSKAPFNAYYKSVKITDYAGGDSAATKPVKEYTYTDKSGNWQSIKAVGGSNGSDDDNSSSSSKEPTKTTSAKESSTKSPSTTDDATTLTTATPSATGGDSTATGSESTSATGTPTTVPGSNGAGRNGLAIGGLLLAAGAMVAQLL